MENDYYKIIKDNKENKIEILGYKKYFNYLYNAKCVISCSLWEDPRFVMIEILYVFLIISSDCEWSKNSLVKMKMDYI